MFPARDSFLGGSRRQEVLPPGRPEPQVSQLRPHAYDTLGTAWTPYSPHNVFQSAI